MIAIGIALCSVSLLVAMLSHRFWFADGSFWIYRFLASSWFISDAPHHRYSGFLLQFPAVAYVRAFGRQGVEGALWLWEFMYGFHPLMSLYCCYEIVRRRGKPELFTFVALSFATATLSNFAFNATSIPLALTFFWPLLLLVLFRRPESDFDRIAIYVLFLIMTFTHESSIIALALLFAVGELKKQIDTKLCAAAVILFILIDLTDVGRGDLGLFWQTYKWIWTSYLAWLAAAVVVGALTTFKLRATNARAAWAGVAVFGLGTLAYAIAAMLTWRFRPTLYDAINFRSLALPLGTVWGAMAVYAYYQGIAFLPQLRTLVMLALIAAAGRDLILTRQHQHASYFLRERLKQPGCAVASYEDYRNNFTIFAISDWSVPYYSALLQLPNPVTSMLYIYDDPKAPRYGMPYRHQFTDPCVALKNGFIMGPYEHTEITRALGVDFSALVRQPNSR